MSIKRSMTSALVLGLYSFLFATNAGSATPSPSNKIARSKVEGASTSEKKPRWLLKSFLEMSASRPTKLLQLADRLFDPDRIRMASIEPGLAYEWQHRLAMVSALADLFDSEGKRRSSSDASQRLQARKIIVRAMTEDPSLLVRDGAVESVRRILRMQPGEAKSWRKPLENAFLHSSNVLEGEGFFIRETILTALKEASIKPSPRVKQAAMRDKNTQVQYLMKSFGGQVWDNM